MPRRNKTQKHTPFTPRIFCETKRAYPSEQAAIKAAELQMLSAALVELTVYRCDQCNKWHLTSRPPKIR